MDNLEELYKNTFDSFERKPRADFWESLEQKIPPKPKKRRNNLTFLILFLAGVCTTTIAFLSYDYYYSNIHFKDLGAFFIPIEKSVNEWPLVQKDNASTIQKSAQLSNQIVNKQTKSLVGTKKQKNQLYLKPISSILSKEEGVEKSTLNSPVSAERTTEKARKKKAYKIDAVEFLPQLSFFPLSTEKEQKRKSHKKLLKKKKYTAVQPFVDLLFSPIGTGTFKIEQSNGTSFSEAVSISKTIGYQLQIGGVIFNNWQFQIGGSHHQFTIQQANRSFIRTNPIGLVQTEQGYSKQYSYTVDGAIESRWGTATLLGTQEQFQNELLPIRYVSQQRVDLTSIHNQIGYRFLIGSRWYFTPLVGVHVTWAKKGRLSLVNAQLLDSPLTLTQYTIGLSSHQKVNIIEGLLGTEFVYRHTRRISFMAATQARFGIQPFYTNFQKNIKHRLGHVQVGVRFQL